MMTPITTLAAWTLALMLMLQPAKITPWAAGYESSASTIVKVSEEAPLFPGPDGVRRTISLYLSLGWYEGRLDPKAKGDGKCIEYEPRPAMFRMGVLVSMTPPKCIKKGPPQSFCMFQVGRSNFSYLGITEEQILGNFEVCIQAARRMILLSFDRCKGRPATELLGHYASGGETCGGLKESAHRMSKASWLFNTFPFPSKRDPS